MAENCTRVDQVHLIGSILTQVDLVAYSYGL